MFKRNKAKPAVPTLRIKNGAGETIYWDELQRLRLPERTILALSVEYFDDPEPCVIHRGAVLKRVFMEIQSACADGEALIAASGARMGEYFGEYAGATTIALEEKPN